MSRLVRLFVVIGVLATPGLSRAATTTYTLDNWANAAGNGCSVCGGTYSCFGCGASSGVPATSATYTDTLPAGALVTRIDVTTNGQRPSGTTTWSFSLNGQSIVSGVQDSPSSFNNCGGCRPDTHAGTTYTTGFPGYLHGSTNTLTLAWNGGVYVLNNIALTVHYNDAPTAVAAAASGAEGSAITMDGSGSSDPDGSVVAWDWDCDNNGSYETTSGTALGGTCTFADDGTFTVGLQVTDDGAATGTTTTTVTVSNVAPTASVVLPNGANEGTLLSFSGTVFDPGDRRLPHLLVDLRRREHLDGAEPHAYLRRRRHRHVRP